MVDPDSNFLFFHGSPYPVISGILPNKCVQHKPETKSAVSQTYQLLFCLTSSQEKQKQNSTQCVCVEVCVLKCVCVLDRQGSVLVASTALVVVWMAVCSYSYSYSDNLTSLRESLSPPY